MTINYTTLLGLAQPVTGTEANTWGTVVNDEITALIEEAIAGGETIDVTSGNVTLTDTDGVANQARNAILLITGTPGTTRNVVAPSQSKAYIVVNGSNGSVVIKGSATTGATIAVGARAIVAWNGSDFVEVGSPGDVDGPASATDNAVARFDGTTGKIIQNSAVTIADDGTTIISVNSASDALRITQTGSGNCLVVEDAANPDSTPFVVDSAGIVIVGDTTSALYSTGIRPAVQLNVAGAAQMGISRWSANASNNALVFLKSRGTTIGDYAVVSSGDSLGAVNFYGADGTAGIQAASISAAVDGTPGTNDMPGRLVFFTTADGASSPTERMRIDSAGNVGIGVTPPAGQTIRIGKSLTGAVSSFSLTNRPAIQSDVTTIAAIYDSFPSTAATSFTLPSLVHYQSAQGTFGAGSTVTNQFGYFAASSLTGATNNFGFYGNIASGTGRWNFYANGTAQNYFAGTTLIGTLTNTNSSTVVSGGTISETSGGTQYLVVSQTDIGSAPNQIPLNQYLGDLAYQDAASIAGNVGVGGSVTANALTVNSNNISADNSLGFRNRIINGDMRIDQRNAGASVTLAAGAITYTVDRFLGFEDTDGAMTAQQDTSAPANFVNSLKFTTTTADASLSATQRVLAQQRIEGTNVADLGWGTANAKTVILSFWVRSSLTGTFGGALQNSASTRAYPFTYSISAANTWEYKTITIAGDTSGTWLTTTGVGIQVNFGLGVGSTYSGTAGAWTNGDLNSATGAVSVIGTLNATWYVTGVQLEAGSVATPFERRPYGTELALCQRYLPEPIVNGTIIMGTALSNTSSYARLTFTIPVRTPPTGISVSAANHFSVYSFNNTTSGAATSVAFASGDSIGGWVQITTTAGSPTLAAGHTTQFYGSNASARLLFTGCEL